MGLHNGSGDAGADGPFHFLMPALPARVFPLLPFGSCHLGSPQDPRAPTRLNTGRSDLILLLAFVCASIRFFLGSGLALCLNHLVI